MKRNIIAIILIITCLVATLATIHQVEAKSSIPTRTITIRQNVKHLYFSPTYPTCVHGNVVQVKLINASQLTTRLLFNGKSGSLKPNSDVTIQLFVQEPSPGYKNFTVVLLEPRGDPYADVVAIIGQC
jgi:hypothetical protein